MNKLDEAGIRALVERAIARGWISRSPKVQEVPNWKIALTKEPRKDKPEVTLQLDTTQFDTAAATAVAKLNLVKVYCKECGCVIRSEAGCLVCKREDKLRRERARGNL